MKIVYLGSPDSCQNNQPEIKNFTNSKNSFIDKKYNTIEQKQELLSLDNTNNFIKSFLKNSNYYINKMKQENTNTDQLSKSSILEIIDYPINKNNEINVPINVNSVGSFIRNSPKIIQGDTDPDIEFNDNDFEIEKKKKIKKTNKEKIYFNINQIKKYFISPKQKKVIKRVNSRNKLKNKINTLNKTPNNFFRKTTEIKLKKKNNLENFKNGFKNDKKAGIFHLKNKNNHNKNKSKEKYTSNKQSKEYIKSLIKIENNDTKIFNNCNSIFEILNETLKGEKTDANTCTNNSSNKINSSKISTITKSKKWQKIKPNKNPVIIYFPKENTHLRSKKNIFKNGSSKRIKNYKLNNPFENIINSSRIYLNHEGSNTSNGKKKKKINLGNNSLRSSKKSSNYNTNYKNTINKSNNSGKKNISKLQFYSPKLKKKLNIKNFIYKNQ